MSLVHSFVHALRAKAYRSVEYYFLELHGFLVAVLMKTQRLFDRILSVRSRFIFSFTVISAYT